MSGSTHGDRKLANPAPNASATDGDTWGYVQGEMRRVLKYRAVTLGLAIAILCGSGLSAQGRGVASGRVIDAGTLEPRAGAGVGLLGTAQGAIAAADGRFIIPGMP